MVMYDIGRYFTEDVRLQDKVKSLCFNEGSALEPSAGAGHLVRACEDNFSFIKAIDLVPSPEPICSTNIEKLDFFDLSLDYKFNTVFGNPPFLKHRKLPKEIVEKMEEGSILKNCNIFYNFIEKSFYHLNDGGEIIFIIPREFLNSTRARPLRELLYNNGTITHLVDYEEQKFFKDASPSIIIMRYEKGNLSHKTLYDRGEAYYEFNETLNFGAYLFTENEVSTYKTLGTFFDVKVGLVTGLNKIYEKDSELSIPTICSDYFKTKQKRNFIFADEYDINEIRDIDFSLYFYLICHKNTLMSRKIKKFNESNWWHYGAVRNLNQMRENGQCIYVNAKTRVQQPFFVDECCYYDGSVLALYPKLGNEDLNKWCRKLNSSEEAFKEQGLYVNNKYSFTVKTLQDFLIK